MGGAPGVGVHSAAGCAVRTITHYVQVTAVNLLSYPEVEPGAGEIDQAMNGKCPVTVGNP
jgi:hypothetical protein